MDNMREEINKRLEEIISQYKDGKIKDAMLYSLMAGGKRLRPIIMLTVIRSYKMDYHPYLDIACAIEMIHTYSLIHDDLPGMDNDDLRRGKPTCHRQFDEATAILAGDALLNEALNVILQVDLDDHLKLSIISELYSASGLNGMIYGQQQDLYFENKKATIEELKEVHHYKTGALIAVSFVLGSLIAHKEDVETWRSIGYDLGLAFQVQDDLLDVIGDEKLLGKKVGSDEANHKSTYVSILGIEESEKYIESLFEECFSGVYALTINHGLILEILETVLKRVS